MNHSLKTTKKATELPIVNLMENPVVNQKVNLNFDWSKVAYYVHLSRALDDREESELVPSKEVLYQFSAYGHAGEATFPEYCQRPTNAEEAEEIQITFSNMAGTTFYNQVQGVI